MTTPRENSKEPLRIPDQCIEYETLIEYGEAYKDNLDAFKAFTWTPDPKRYRSTDPYRQYEDLLLNILLKKEMEQTFTAYVFVPELNENGNIHIHGYYNVKDVVKYNRWFLPACKHWGYTCIKKKVDLKWMIDYLAKEIDNTSQVVYPLQSVITHDNRGDSMFLIDVEKRVKKEKNLKVKHTPIKKVGITRKGILKYF